jgi:Protein of unknown function (DUF1214)
MVRYNPDGSLKVYLQSKSPGTDKESNWLPIPQSGLVNVTIRVYDPKDEAKSKGYKIPPILKIVDRFAIWKICPCSTGRRELLSQFPFLVSPWPPFLPVARR